MSERLVVDHPIPSHHTLIPRGLGLVRPIFGFAISELCTELKEIASNYPGVEVRMPSETEITDRNGSEKQPAIEMLKIADLRRNTEVLGEVNKREAVEALDEELTSLSRGYEAVEFGELEFDTAGRSEETYVGIQPVSIQIQRTLLYEHLSILEILASCAEKELTDLKLPTRALDARLVYLPKGTASGAFEDIQEVSSHYQGITANISAART